MIKIINCLLFYFSTTFLLFFATTAWSEYAFSKEEKLVYVRQCAETVFPVTKTFDHDYDPIELQGNENAVASATIRYLSSFMENYLSAKYYNKKSKYSIDSWYPDKSKIINLDESGADIEVVIRLTATEPKGGMKGWGVEKDFKRNEYIVCVYLDSEKNVIKPPTFFIRYSISNGSGIVYGLRKLNYMNKEINLWLDMRTKYNEFNKSMNKTRLGGNWLPSHLDILVENYLLLPRGHQVIPEAFKFELSE